MCIRDRYIADSLLDYIEASVDEINSQFPSATIVLAGDFNQLSDHDVVERTGTSSTGHSWSEYIRSYVRVTTSVLGRQSGNICHAKRSQSDRSIC